MTVILMSNMHTEKMQDPVWRKKWPVLVERIVLLTF